MVFLLFFLAILGYDLKLVREIPYFIQHFDGHRGMEHVKIGS